MTFSPISSSHPPSNAIVKAFRHFVDNHHDEHIHDGVDGHGETRRFVCRKGLFSYWTPKRIAAALGLEDVPLSSEFFITKTRKSYIKVLSTLCYIGFPDALLAVVVSNGISDADLPISPDNYDTKNRQMFPFCSQSLLRAFFEAQWIFSPVIFKDGIHRAKLSADQVLPIRHQEELPVRTGMENTKIYRVEFHDCCNNLPVNEVVFKTMNAKLCPWLGCLWEREAAAYAKIFQQSQLQVEMPTPRSNTWGEQRNLRHPQGVIKCFGSFAFAQGETSSPESEARTRENEGNPQAYTHFLILEYATGGTLEDFLKENTSLTSSLRCEDQRNFWSQLFNSLVGLQEIADLNLTHQDLKMSNFLDLGTDLSDINNPRFKQADFGTSVDGDTLRDGDSFVNLVHMAPECIGGLRYPQLPQPQPFTSQADTWALGCMLSDILVRTRLGQQGSEEYERRRQEEIASSGKPIRGTEWRHGYHDGVKRLSCVDEMHRRALESCQQDSILHLASRIILNMMLQPIEIRQRVSAGEIRAAWLKGLEKLEKMRHGVARSQLVVVRRAAPSTAQRHKVPECFSKAISICPSSFMVQSMSPSARWEFSGQLRWPFDHQTRVGLVSISVRATILSLLTDTRSTDYWEGRNKNFIGNQNLIVTSSAPLAPARQPQRKSLNRHLKNVRLMAFLWLGYLLMNVEWPAVTRARCPFTRDKVNIKEGGQSAVVCPWKGGLPAGCIFVTQPRRKVPGRIRGRL